MHLMKRVGLIVFGLAALALLTAAVDVRMPLPGAVVRANVAEAGTGTPVPTKTPGKDPFANAGPVCVALPIFLGGAGGTQGACKKGQVEIPNDSNSGGAIVFYLKLVLRLTNGIVGGVILLMLVIGGIQYIMSAGDPGNVKKAKGMVMNAIIGLVLYLMMFAILNFLIPGGVFS